MTSILDSLKPPDTLARRIARAEGRLERMIRGGPSWRGARDWLAGFRPAADRSTFGHSTRAIADELMRLGAEATSPRYRPIGKVVLVAAGLGLLAALARRS